jgi:AcrR family transcriptional regulator
MSRLKTPSRPRAVAPAPITGQRARSGDDKALRRAHLLDAAAAQLAAAPYESITMATVAEAAGLAKASAYTYFPTREALFLALLERELGSWALDLQASLCRRPRSARTLAATLAASVAGRPMLRELLSRMHSTLEANVPPGEVLEFKRRLAALLAGGGALLEQALPGLAGRGEQALLVTYALVIGLGQLAEPSPAAAAALAAEPALEARFRIPFEPTLAGLLDTLLSAWTAPASRRDP